MALLLFSCAAFVTASLSDGPKRYCGEQLSYTLSLYCRKRFDHGLDKSWFEIEGKYNQYSSINIFKGVFVCIR